MHDMHHAHHRGIAALRDSSQAVEFDPEDARTVRVERHGADGANDTTGAQDAASRRRVVFVGNPNVGKSSLFNSMLGMHAKVMNAPGTTVLLESGTYDYRRQDEHQTWDFIDTPGTYSLLAMSPDEAVAARAAIGADGDPRPDLIVAAIDATNLSRSLYFLAQVFELGRPTVVALTMSDLAAKRGIHVSAEGLSAAIGGVPVVTVDGRTGAGSDRLADAIAGSFPGTPMPRGLEVRPVTGDMVDWVESRSDARFDWAYGVLESLGVGATSQVTASDGADRVLLHPVWGIVTFLCVMFIVFQSTTWLAGPAQDWFDVTVRAWLSQGADWVLGLFGADGGWLRSLAVDGLLDGVVTVLTFIPPMGIMLVLLAVLEDCGYLARAAFVMDRAMRFLGLDGRAFLPIVVGFGCNLPGLAATRTLPDSRQRVLTGMLIPFASCSARLSVYLVLAHAFFGSGAGAVVFLMYVASIVLILGVGVLLRHTMFRGMEPEPFAMSLPAYQMPRIVQLVRTVLLRLWNFVTGASGIIISMIMVLWLLQGIPVVQGAGTFANVDDVHSTAYGAVADAVAPVFAPAGFDDWHASAALITGFVAKEVVVGSMNQSYAIENSDDDTGGAVLGESIRADFDRSSGGHGRAAAMAFMLFVLSYTPCLATVAEMKRQYGWRVAARGVGLGLAVGYVLAVVSFQLLRFVL